MFAPRNDIKTFYIQTTTCKNKFFDSPDTSHSPVNKLVAKATAFCTQKRILWAEMPSWCSIWAQSLNSTYLICHGNFQAGFLCNASVRNSGCARPDVVTQKLQLNKYGRNRKIEGRLSFHVSPRLRNKRTDGSTAVSRYSLAHKLVD